jgi:hypothetical protein
LTALPWSAISPVFGIVADDFDDDSKTDIWLGEIFMHLNPRLEDIMQARSLSKRRRRQAVYVCFSIKSGISVEGEVRDAWNYSNKGSKHVIIGRNNAKVLLFKQ